MKRIFLQSVICILLFISLSVTNSFAQANEKIHHLEYFFDTDPGFGLATQVTVATPSVNVSNLNFTPNISALQKGLHTLHVRAVDSLYRRSITTSQLFYKETVTSNAISNIVAGEYFFDTDPGFGLASTAAVIAGQTVTFNFSGSISSLTNGLHNLFVRTLDAAGKWSISPPQLFYKQAAVANSVANITDAEYFFDTDPGFGAATTATVTPGQTITFSFIGSITSLTNGLHNLFVRTKDANGKWSLSAPQLFYKQALINNPVANIASAEYYFDADPGFGNATSASVTAGQMITFAFTGSITSLSNGLHNLFVRTKDANGKWSLTTPQLFYKQGSVSNTVPNLVAAEYYFDADPGFGNATAAAITAGQTVTFNFAGNVASLATGFHNLFVRTLDANGNWSHTVPKIFYILPPPPNSIPNLVAAEYFFDTDPGFGLATAATLSAGQMVTFNITGNIAPLTNGLHNLFVRTKDALGHWSLSVPQLFYKEALLNNPVSNITSAEYFFDTDPGFGIATAATVTAGQTVTFNFAGNISTLTNGLHNLFVRTRDANGKWSLSTAQLFYKEALLNNPIPNITSAEYFFDTDPGFGNAFAAAVTAGQNINFNFTGNITALANGLHYLYVRSRDINGKWSLSTPQLFYKEPVINNPIPNIVAAEYYVDSDPGFGSGTAFTVSPQGQTIIQNFNFASTSLTRGLHRLYIRVRDANGKWSLTNTHLFYYETLLPVNPVDQFVKLEWFWNNDPGFGNANAVSIPAGNNGQITNFAFNVPVPNSVSNTKQNLFVRVLDDWSLTTVKMVDFTNILLPVILLEFSAKAQDNAVLTKWITTQEINSDHFEVEHSADGISFYKIGTVTAQGQSNTASNYELLHRNPVNGVNYYRLKQVDKNGQFEYSGIVKILFNVKGIIKAYPNPVTDKLNVTVAQSLIQNSKLVLQFYDAKGIIVMQKAITERTNMINLSQLSAGSYSMRIVNEKGEIVDSRIIVKQ